MIRSDDPLELAPYEYGWLAGATDALCYLENLMLCRGYSRQRAFAALRHYLNTAGAEWLAEAIARAKSPILTEAERIAEARFRGETK